MLLHLGVTSLVNSSIQFQSDEGDQLYFIGLDEISLGRHNLEQAMDEVDPNSFKILVCHNPEYKQENSFRIWNKFIVIRSYTWWTNTSFWV